MSEKNEKSKVSSLLTLSQKVLPCRVYLDHKKIEAIDMEYYSLMEMDIADVDVIKQGLIKLKTSLQKELSEKSNIGEFNLFILQCDLKKTINLLKILENL